MSWTEVLLKQALARIDPLNLIEKVVSGAVLNPSELAVVKILKGAFTNSLTGDVAWEITVQAIRDKGFEPIVLPYLSLMASDGAVPTSLSGAKPMVMELLDRVTSRTQDAPVPRVVQCSHCTKHFMA